MRARNLKPSIFKNELLATSDPLYAWIFEGLWCLSDREGRLEDRPRRIHFEINAGRAFEGTETALAWLAEHGFILRYQHGENRYIQVVSFTKHQNPHVREPTSTIPAPGSNGASIVPASDEHQSGPALSPFPLPDSPFLTPLSPFLTARAEDRPRTRTVVTRETITEDQRLDFKVAYPERNGDQRWHEAWKAMNARFREGHTFEEILAGAQRYAIWCEATGKLGTEMVKQAATFVGPGKPFLQPWHPPPKAETATERLLRLNSETDESRVIEHDPTEPFAITRQ